MKKSMQNRLHRSIRGGLLLVHLHLAPLVCSNIMKNAARAKLNCEPSRPQVRPVICTIELTFPITFT
jgi:hypothetical protein